ncbi:hypothetical protein C8J57DRAFT_1235890 [Mycena rebaudengoi]|nr:hypothetical protein C8J57DRAFT_1235890 [Mycena rebaudengoi]
MTGERCKKESEEKRFCQRWWHWQKHQRTSRATTKRYPPEDAETRAMYNLFKNAFGKACLKSITPGIGLQWGRGSPESVQTRTVMGRIDGNVAWESRLIVYCMIPTSDPEAPPWDGEWNSEIFPPPSLTVHPPFIQHPAVQPTANSSDSGGDSPMSFVKDHYGSRDAPLSPMDEDSEMGHASDHGGLEGGLIVLGVDGAVLPWIQWGNPLQTATVMTLKLQEATSLASLRPTLLDTAEQGATYTYGLSVIIRGRVRATRSISSTMNGAPVRVPVVLLFLDGHFGSLVEVESSLRRCDRSEGGVCLSDYSILAQEIRVL